MQLVRTDKGWVSGTIIGEPGKEVSVFRGIPYAAPPVGPLRWRPPQRAEAWNGIRECTAFAAMSPQAVVPVMTAPLPISEDCLYLNVVTPAREPDEKLPVMVWMHGGGYDMGCGSDRIWNNYRLPSYGVVVVTLTHRLGPIGLMAHPWLNKESERGVSGNYLFLDLIASLEWIQKNIAAFGGDPDNITIFGESGGGAKVSMMMSSPLAKGLFHKCICQSGTATAILGAKPMPESEQRGIELLEKIGVKTLDEARNVPWEKIIQANQDIVAAGDPSTPLARLWDGTVDGWVLPDSPAALFKSGAINAAPLIVCANLGELTGPGPLVMPFIIKAYVDMLVAVGKKGKAGYACIFDQVPSRWKKEGCVSIHSAELTYVFGDWDDTSGWWDNIRLAVKSAGAKSDDPGLDAADRYVSEAMMGFWTSFAKDGKPRADGVANWLAFEPVNEPYMYINSPCEARTGFSRVVD